MKIKLIGPPYTHIDTANEVEIREAFTGPLFITGEGETLGICMRDSGFEMTYQDRSGGKVQVIRANVGEVTVTEELD